MQKNEGNQNLATWKPHCLHRTSPTYECHKQQSRLPLVQVLRALEVGYCQPPPPGCPRNIYKLMVECWWASLHATATVVGWGAKWGIIECENFQIIIAWRCECSKVTVYLQVFICILYNTTASTTLLSDNSVEFVCSQTPNMLNNMPLHAQRLWIIAWEVSSKH